MSNRNIFILILFSFITLSASQETIKKLFYVHPKYLFLGAVLGISGALILDGAKKQYYIRRKIEKRKKKELLYVDQKEILEEGEDHKFDYRPIALSGKIEGNFGLYNEQQVAYLLAFYQRHENLLKEMRLKNEIDDTVWDDFLKKRESYNRYIWKNIYRKKQEKSAQWPVINQETKKYIEDVLKTADIEPSSLRIKQKNLGYPGEHQHKIYKCSSSENFYHIKYPAIVLENIPFMKLGDKKTFIHESGHAYLCHYPNGVLFSKIPTLYFLPFKKLCEVEADCILAILNKKYAKTILEIYIESCKIERENFKFIKEEYRNTLEVTLWEKTGDDRPSYFERLIHICDLCRQVWNIDVSKAIAKIIPNKIEHQIFMKSLVEIDPTHQYYLPLINLNNFQLEFDRIKTDPHYEGFNFISRTRNIDF